MHGQHFHKYLQKNVVAQPTSSFESLTTSG